MKFERLRGSIIPFALAASIGMTFFLFLLRPVNDADFFWHLKTGQWILQNRMLPSQDMFSYTAPEQLSLRGNMLLKCYWLSQLLFASAYEYGGVYGLFILRASMAALLFYIMFKSRRGDRTLYSALMLIFIFSVLVAYPVERPHVFSFIYFAALLFLLEKIIRPGEEGPVSPVIIAAAPLVMLLWANSHRGGYLLGQAAIVLCLTVEGIKFIHPRLRPAGKKNYARLAAAGLLGIVFSLANPNTYHSLEIVREVASSDYSLYLNLEYQPLLRTLREYNNYSALLCFFLGSLAASGIIINIKNADITRVILAGGLGYLAFMQLRYVPFFLIAALPAIGENLSAQRLLKPLKYPVIAAAFFAAFYFTGDEVSNVNKILNGKWINERLYPVGAARFIAENDLKGNMFNEFNWGGYLIWKLAPHKKVFIDGRIVSEKALWQYLTIRIAMDGSGSSVPQWKGLLDQYGVKFIVMPLTEAGTVIPLVAELLNDKEWALVYSDAVALVFVKNTPENSEVIKRYASRA